jgi:hypothetical protein
MKLLMFLAKHFRFRTYEKTLESVEFLDQASDIPEAAVIFMHAQSQDVSRLEPVFSKTLKNIKWLANKKGFRNIVLHSFTHLGGESAPPEFAQTLIEDLSERLKKTGYQVWTTPFGHVCEWDLSVYGESLAKVYKEL